MSQWSNNNNNNILVFDNGTCSYQQTNDPFDYLSFIDYPEGELDQSDDGDDDDDDQEELGESPHLVSIDNYGNLFAINDHDHVNSSSSSSSLSGSNSKQTILCHVTPRRNDSCSICLENFIDSQENEKYMFCSLICGQVFHSTCLFSARTYHQQNFSSFTFHCPYCRTGTVFLDK